MAKETKHSKYLTFMLAKEGYGIDIQKVKEINEMVNITPIPETPGYMKGIINLRGRIIPVIDLRERFGMRVPEDVLRSCIIVCEIESKGEIRLTGLIVDQVSEVCEIKEEMVEKNVALGATVKSDYITGIAKVNDEVKILRNINKVLGADELEEIHVAAEENKASAVEITKDDE